MLSKRILPFIIVLVTIAIVLAYVFRDHGVTPFSTSRTALHIDTWQTKNGAHVYYVSAPQLPMVDIRVVFNAGSARDGDKPGLAHLTSALLADGAGDWDTSQIVSRFDSVGAHFSTTSQRDMAVVSLRSLTDKDWFNTALTTMAAVVQKPAFPQSELDRERQQTLVALRNQQESPEALTQVAFYKALYNTQPYATPPLGTKDSVNTLTRQDVMDFYRKYYVAANAVVVIVGNVKKAGAKHIAQTLMQGLPSGEAAPALPAVAPVEKARTIRIQHPSTQTTIWVGQPGVTRTDPDYFPLYVGNHILGGSGFSSRILKQIRVKRGLAYSAYSYFFPMASKGPFVMGLQTKNDQASEALDLLNKTLDKFIAEGPTAKELADAKKNITGGFALRIDSNRKITEYVAMIGFYHLPLDYLQTFNKKVEKVTRAQIMDAFKRRIHPDRMITVMVGDLDKSASKSK